MRPARRKEGNLRLCVCRRLSSVLRVSRGDRDFGLLDNGRKGRRLVDRQIGQYFAVDQKAGLGEPVDEPAVVQAERPNRRVEPLDPQGPEGALATRAVAVGVLVGLLYRLLGDADGVLAPAVIALGGIEDFLVPGVHDATAFEACYG